MGQRQRKWRETKQQPGTYSHVGRILWHNPVLCLICPDFSPKIRVQICSLISFGPQVNLAPVVVVARRGGLPTQRPRCIFSPQFNLPNERARACVETAREEGGSRESPALDRLHLFCTRNKDLGDLGAVPKMCPGLVTKGLDDAFSF